MQVILTVFGILTLHAALGVLITAGIDAGGASAVLGVAELACINLAAGAAAIATWAAPLAPADARQPAELVSMFAYFAAHTLSTAHAVWAVLAADAPDSVRVGAGFVMIGYTLLLLSGR